MTEQDTTQNIDIITIYTFHLAIFLYDKYWNKTEGRQFLMQAQWFITVELGLREIEVRVLDCLVVDDKRTTFFQNVGNKAPNDTASYPRKY
jgi:hypothetical protein